MLTKEEQLKRNVRGGWITFVSVLGLLAIVFICFIMRWPFGVVTEADKEAARKKYETYGTAELAEMDRLSAQLEALNSSLITPEEYGQLQVGMTRSQVEAVVGSPGKIISENVLGGFHTVMLSWENPDGSNALVMLQNNRVTQLSQYGL